TQLPSIRWRSRSRRGGQDSIGARQITNDAMNRPAMNPEQLAQRLALAIRKFDEQAAAGLQELGRPLRQGAVKFEAISAAIQRQARVVVAHLRLQQLDFRRRNVRRIGDNYVEALRWLQSR